MGLSINLFTKKKNNKHNKNSKQSFIGKIFSGIGDIISRVIVFIIVIAILLSIVWYFNPSFIQFLIK